MSVESARPRDAGASAGPVAVSAVSLTRSPYAGMRSKTGLWYDLSRPLRGLFHEMPNIRQQKKRVRTASEQRLENLRYVSTIKTLTKRLARAVARGAIHRNTAARRKSQAARLVGAKK